MSYCRLSALAVLIAALFLVAAPAGADDGEPTTFVSIDVGDLLRTPKRIAGLRLGIVPSNHTWPERKMSPRRKERGYLTTGELAELVTAVAPKSWDTVAGAEADVVDGRLLIRNRKDVVDGVRVLIDRLRAHASRRALVSVDYITGPAGTYPGLPGGAGAAQSLSMALVPGIGSSTSITNRTSYVGDYEVEIAQGSNISNPIAYEAVGGLTAEMVGTPVSDGAGVVLSGVLQFGSVERMRRHTLGVDEENIAHPFRSDKRFQNGVVELPEFRHTIATFNTVLANGGEVLIPVVRDGQQHTFRVRSTVQGGGTLDGILDLGGLTHRPLDGEIVIVKEVGADGWFPGEYEVPFPLMRFPALGDTRRIAEPDALTELLRRAVKNFEDDVDESRVYGTDRLRLQTSPATLRASRAFLDRMAANELRPLVADVRVLTVPKGSVTLGPGGIVQGDGASLVAGGQVHTLNGRIGSLMAGRKQAYIADYDVEVAQDARIADPFIAVAFDGLVVNVTPYAAAGSRRVSVDLSMRLAATSIDETPFESKLQYLGPVDRARSERTAVDTSIEMGLGERYLIDGGADPRNEDRRLVIVVQVTARK